MVWRDAFSHFEDVLVQILALCQSLYHLKNEGETIPASRASPNKKADSWHALGRLTRSDKRNWQIHFHNNTTTRSEISFFKQPRCITLTFTEELIESWAPILVHTKLTTNCSLWKPKLRCAKKGWLQRLWEPEPKDVWPTKNTSLFQRSNCKSIKPSLSRH